MTNVTSHLPIDAGSWFRFAYLASDSTGRSHYVFCNTMGNWIAAREQPASYIAHWRIDPGGIISAHVATNEKGYYIYEPMPADCPAPTA